MEEDILIDFETILLFRSTLNKIRKSHFFIKCIADEITTDYFFTDSEALNKNHLKLKQLRVELQNYEKLLRLFKKTKPFILP